MARGGEGAFGGRQINSVPIWLGLLRDLPARARRPPPPAQRAEPRPARPALVLGLALVLQPRRHLHERAARVPADALPARAHGLGRAGAAGPASSRAVWPVWLLAAATVFLAGFRIGLNVRDSNVIDVGYSGVIGAHRIVARPVPVRAHAGRGRPEGVRPGGRRGRDPRARPDERALRVGERARRHVRPGRLRGVRPGVPRARLEREVGRPSRVARDGDRLRPARAPRAVPRRAPLRRRTARRAAPVRLGRLPVHAVRVELEHERRDHARAARLRLLVPDDAVRARRVPRARRVDEVRGARRRAALGRVSGGALAPGEALICRRFCRRDACSRSRSSSSSRTRLTRRRVFWDRTFGWQVGRDSPFSIWGWGQYHAAGIPDLGVAPAGRDRRCSSSARSPATSSRGARRRSSSPRSPRRS